MNDADFVAALDLITAGAGARCAHRYKDYLPDIRRHYQAYRGLLRSRNVVGMGIGDKQFTGPRTGQLALRFYVKKKLAKGKARVAVPPQIDTPGIGRLPTDVVEIGEIKLQNSRTARHRPAPPGSSVGIGLVSGTLGCVVKKSDGSPGLYLLSNAHVIARDGVADPETSVYQPSLVDDPQPNPAAFAHLSRVVPFEFSPSSNNNLVDAAIAKIKKTADAETRIMDLGAPQGVSSPRRCMQVKKSGRSSGLTSGSIEDIHFMTDLVYQSDQFGSTGRVGFREQILVSKFSEDGDSGSLVVSNSNRAVGLLFAGSDLVSVCSRIRHVFKLLDVDLA